MTAAVLKRPTLSDGPSLARDEFNAIAALVHAAAGIVLPPGKSMLVQSRLARLLREAGDASFGAYIARIERDADERTRMIEALTTNHTSFFRENHHFEHLARELRPELLKRAAAGEPVRLWSAGSSSGEEVYSIAMTLLGSDPAAARPLLERDVALLASDLASHVLRTARTGVYAASATDSIPADLRSRWTRSAEGKLTIAEPVRRLIRFRQLNLLGEWPIKGRFDAIFCRNTMIYFDESTKARLLARFSEVLKPGGHLYIGHSERLVGPVAAQFIAVGQTIYRKAMQ